MSIVTIILGVMLLYVLYMSGREILELLYDSDYSQLEFEEFNHKTKMLEIECLGQEWWDAWGTECDCTKCVKPVPPKGSGGGSRWEPPPGIVVTADPSAEKSRIEHFDGYQFTRPSDVPDNAYASINPSDNMSGNTDFAKVRFRWIDPVSGKEATVFVMATRDQFMAVHKPEFFTPNELRQIDKEKNAILRTYNDARSRHIDYDAALDNYNNKM